MSNKKSPICRVRKRPIGEVVLSYFYESQTISVCYNQISGSADYQIYAYYIVSDDLKSWWVLYTVFCSVHEDTIVLIYN